MPYQSQLDSTIDPLTGTTGLAEGADVYVRDDLGRRHRGTILAVHPGDDIRYTVLLMCGKKEREVTVAEADLLARVHTESGR